MRPVSPGSPADQARNAQRIAALLAPLFLLILGLRATPDSLAVETPLSIGSLNIREYRVVGAQLLNEGEIGEAVYPFLGPGRTEGDVRAAGAALEKAYREKGYQTVAVEIPAQQMRRGVVVLRVVEAKVGRLRVKGSRYFSLEAIKRGAPSVAEGKVPNFAEITRDIVGLNQLPDRKVTPALRKGVEPGTVDIDLTVEDKRPLHGSVEFNNRYSADTTELRLNASVSYGNLWQRGHALGFSFQIAPERPDDALVYSAYYLARFESVPWLSLMALGTKQDSNVSTLGGAAVAGRGEIIGARALITLPALPNFYHSASLGIDYKHFAENVIFGTTLSSTPISYYPLSANYNATWLGKGYPKKPTSLTELNASLNFHLRGLGSNSESFDEKRFRADGSYIYLRADLAHTRDLPGGLEVFGKVQGQMASQPLINSEQFSGGGLGTVRGYLESAALGDNGIFGSLELRSPALSAWLGDKVLKEWRLYAFVEGGLLTLHDPLPEQVSRFELASIGVGSRLQVLENCNTSIDAGLPLISQSSTSARDLLLTFRVWAEF